MSPSAQRKRTNNSCDRCQNEQEAVSFANISEMTQPNQPGNLPLHNETLLLRLEAPKHDPTSSASSNDGDCPLRWPRPKTNRKRSVWEEYFQTNIPKPAGQLRNTPAYKFARSFRACKEGCFSTGRTDVYCSDQNKTNKKRWVPPLFRKRNQTNRATYLETLLGCSEAPKTDPTTSAASSNNGDCLLSWPRPKRTESGQFD
jgi:hypothetical protein